MIAQGLEADDCKYNQRIVRRSSMNGIYQYLHLFQFVIWKQKPEHIPVSQHIVFHLHLQLDIFVLGMLQVLFA